MDILSLLLQWWRPPKLTIELVPRSCWGKNVRALVSPDRWREIQQTVFDRAGGKCQICGWPGDLPRQRPRFDCHEVWHYDAWKGVQRLDGFVALCRFCHEVKHLGRARSEGRYAQAIAHLAKVNGWSRKAAIRYADASFKTLERRSHRRWTQDLTVLYDWLAR